MRRYAITNRAPYVGDGVEATASASDTSGLLEDLRRWAREGVQYIQLREKDLPEQALRQLVRAALRARDQGLQERRKGIGVAPVSIAGEGTRVLVSTSVEAALAEGADGVHLTGAWARSGAANRGELAGRIAEIRRQYAAGGRPQPILSISCHTVSEVRSASSAGLDLLLFGPVFGKVVGGHPVREGVGLACLRQACDAAGGVPLYALGGVTWANAEVCLAAGAAGVAGIRLFQLPQDSNADPRASTE